ncbi:hypothetical protein Y1Q_0023299 [Alligator mississippiensis]|uniref:Uncharacterized protein n=1 Tax=Alligator mississippiensis TaxID=8496 RepID=A0A151NDG9_ALLMI|nr:hypothetical protein Y1Q_0023299 [Alligator mississippiensis]
MVAISPCMKAQGTLEPTKGHFSPLGQYTSPAAPCALMKSREQGKQNLWPGTEGHCTKWVSSRRSWQMVQHSGALGGPPDESGVLPLGSGPPEECAAEEEEEEEGATAVAASPLRGTRRWGPVAAGEAGLALLWRVVECTGLASLGDWPAPSASATFLSAAMGEGSLRGAAS